ncbi:sulfite exporter TauE/SafE family protein [Pseudalkalibacillus caeni]|uniref:Probable membrane transporter protein n=1 Tax=Exobacillus caeni TaxID=2574798 RepID=A0A5R9F475_9BACL|nr:sulfite exporter TauE/SafE family protein [Pseudalkalibacillus caeni]TLS37190.1 sulfite exporter TauE/SafE family protein [Pseudalkalibacillus caeni]
MNTFVIFIVIILIAAILQTSTGFGFSIMATPFLLLLFQPKEAIQINLVLSLVISLSLILKIRKDIDFGIVKRFMVGSIPGLPVGILVFTLFNMDLLKISVSITIILLTFLLIMKFRIQQTKKRDLVAGGLSGALTTSIGMPGPPLLLYFSGTDTRKEKLRATTLAFYLFIYFVSLLIQSLVAGTSVTVWKWGLLAMPAVGIGLFLGQVLFQKISQSMFRVFTYVLLFFTGIYLLFESL